MSNVIIGKAVWTEYGEHMPGTFYEWWYGTFDFRTNVSIERGVSRETLVLACDEVRARLQHEMEKHLHCCETATESLAHRQTVTIDAEGYRGLTGHVTGYAGDGRYRIFVVKHGLEMSFHISELKAIAP